jgi:FAD synthetase
VVSTDKNREVYSGESPIVPEQQRLELVKSIKNVKDAILGRHDNDTLKTVEAINPDIVLLGPDQKFSVAKLQNALKMKGMNHIKVKRLIEFYDKFKLFSSSLIKNKIIEKYKENHQ